MLTPGKTPAIDFQAAAASSKRSANLCISSNCWRLPPLSGCIRAARRRFCLTKIRSQEPGGLSHSSPKGPPRKNEGMFNKRDHLKRWIILPKHQFSDICSFSGGLTFPNIFGNWDFPNSNKWFNGILGRWRTELLMVQTSGGHLFRLDATSGFFYIPAGWRRISEPWTVMSSSVVGFVSSNDWKKTPKKKIPSKWWFSVEFQGKLWQNIPVPPRTQLLLCAMLVNSHGQLKGTTPKL